MSAAIEPSHYVCTVRRSRAKAVALAQAEAASLLRACGVRLPAGGPLSERRGVYWVDLPESHAAGADEQMERFGYTERVELLIPVAAAARGSGDGPVKWKGGWYELIPVWESDEQEIRLSSADMRGFALRGEDGLVRDARGYRGDGSSHGPKALPVPDCRLLLNLALAPRAAFVLDPFAGAGGIVYEACRWGYRVSSMDLEPSVAPGLEGFGSSHVVGDAAGMPFDAGRFDAIATELPYAEERPAVIDRWVGEMVRVVSLEARCAIMCSGVQCGLITSAAARRGAAVEVCESVRRRGADVAVVVLRRSGER